MAKNTYRKKEASDFGWLTTLPMPKKDDAMKMGKQLLKQYQEVQVVPSMTGFSVRYRKPKGVK